MNSTNNFDICMILKEAIVRQRLFEGSLSPVERKQNCKFLCSILMNKMRDVRSKLMMDEVRIRKMWFLGFLLILFIFLICQNTQYFLNFQIMMRLNIQQQIQLMFPNPYIGFQQFSYPYVQPLDDFFQQSFTENFETFPVFYPFSPYESWNLTQICSNSHSQEEQKQGKKDFFDTTETLKGISIKYQEKRKRRQFRPKKNVQSNICNQVFSYLLNSQKSKNEIQKLLESDPVKMNVFYKYMEVFFKSKKKYLSRKYLAQLCLFTEDREEWKSILQNYPRCPLKIEEFKMVVSFLIFHYLRIKCCANLLTSLKLSPELRKQHLTRKRQILSFLEEYIKPTFKFSY